MRVRERARWRRLLAGAAALLAAGPVGAAGDEVVATPEASDARSVSDWVEGHLAEVLADYRDLHAHPELSGEETRTAARVAESLRAAGFDVSEGVGGTGVVGVLENGPGRTLLIRGDMDGLPVAEETGLPYASRVRVEREGGGEVGVMHACGHDVHTANLLGVARLLADLRSEWAGTVLIVAQPAEEVGRGALAMIRDGLFERFPRPEAAIALHVESELPAGHVAVVPGWATANVDSVDVTIHGRGGHGARPHRAADPVVAAAHLVTALQTLVSRRVDPLAPAVVTVGSIHGGHKHNVIPDEVHLQLTVRSYADEVRELLIGGIQQLARDTCASFQCAAPPTVAVKADYTPAGYNDPLLTESAASLFGGLFGAERVHRLEPSMGGEDFGRYARTLEAPGLQFRLGTASDERWRRRHEEPLPSLHSSRFAPDPEPTLRTGLRALAGLALALLAEPGPAGS